MTPIETLLSAGDLAYLRHHNIAPTDVFDARAMCRDEWIAYGRKHGLNFIVGARCKKGGHRLRTRSGHCIQCNPQAIKHQKSHRKPGEVYIAWSKRGGLIKIGSAEDAAYRITLLNDERYAEQSDWERVAFFTSAEAQATENSIQTELLAFQAMGFRRRDGSKSREVFHCTDETVQTIVGVFQAAMTREKKCA